MAFIRDTLIAASLLFSTFTYAQKADTLDVKLDRSMILDFKKSELKVVDDFDNNGLADTLLLTNLFQGSIYSKQSSFYCTPKLTYDDAKTFTFGMFSNDVFKHNSYYQVILESNNFNNDTIPDFRVLIKAFKNESSFEADKKESSLGFKYINLYPKKKSFKMFYCE